MIKNVKAVLNSLTNALIVLIYKIELKLLAVTVYKVIMKVMIFNV